MDNWCLRPNSRLLEIEDELSRLEEEIKTLEEDNIHLAIKSIELGITKDERGRYDHNIVVLKAYRIARLELKEEIEKLGGEDVFRKRM